MSDKKPNKKPYRPSPWSWIGPTKDTPPDTRRKLTVFVAGVVPQNLPQRLDRMTSQYELITVACAGPRSGEKDSAMETVLKSWARARRQSQITIPWEDLNTVPGWMQFMMPDGNKAVLVYDDGLGRDDVKFAEALGKEENVQYRKINAAPSDDFTKAVEHISKTDGELAK